jgi:hypothetical protein
MKVRSVALSILVSAAMVSPSLLRADNITYNIDQTVGAGSVTGTITTDGTIGALNTGGVIDGPVGFAGNIVDVNLVLSDGTNTEPLSGGIFSSAGSDLIASATDLTFDFGAPGYFVLYSGYSNYDQLCYSTNCGGISIYNVGLDGETVGISETGTQVIGTTTPVPDASSLSLAGITALGILGAFRKKFMISPRSC